VFLDNGVADGQAETCTAAVQLGSEKGVENLFHHIRRHATPLVPDLDNHTPFRLVAVQRDIDPGLPARKGLEGIHDQIDDDLLQLLEASSNTGVGRVR